ncbi:MAG: hypothetical protein NTX17_08875 [Candidatus Eisenbacteria bacterium]|nr:hypothetical protein [Candidatus Eisenbacteria bacterium]
MFRSSVMVIVGVCLLFGQALGCGTQLCWNTVVPRNMVGFDLNVISTVDGPDKSGLYTYTYTIYRLDNGLKLDNGAWVLYREISHISFWFPCGPAAERSIVNGKYGISVSCTDAGQCPTIEMGGSRGMVEPVMSRSCSVFWGFKLDACVCPDDRIFLLPNLNKISFPTDPEDPHCTITFKSGSAPEWGKWLAKGGATRGGLHDGMGWVYDAGDIKVPTCVPAVDVGDMTWGAIKATYR